MFTVWWGACAHAHWWGPEEDFRCLALSLSSSFPWNRSLNEAGARLPTGKSQWFFSLCLSQCWGCRGMQLHLAFDMGTGIGTQILMLAQQALLLAEPSSQPLSYCLCNMTRLLCLQLTNLACLIFTSHLSGFSSNVSSESCPLTIWLSISPIPNVSPP